MMFTNLKARLAMGKLKYLIRRIAGMNYRQFFQKIDEVHKKSGKCKLFIFFDMVWCGLVYQAGYMLRCMTSTVPSARR